MGVIDAGVSRPNLLGGRLRLLIAPTSVAIPTTIDDVVAMVSPYAKKTGWVELGATSDSTTYEMSLDSEEWYIQQSSQTVGERITEQVRSVTTTLAEFTPQNIRYAEEAGTDTAVAAAAGKGAQTRVRSGQINNRTVYRLALVGERDQVFGSTVTEPTGITRGPLFLLCGHRALLAPEDQEIEFESEDLTGREIQWNLYPDSTITNTSEDTVSWFFEATGQTTIT